MKAPIDILGLSNGARAGLTGFVAGIARKTVRHNVTINGLLPGPFDTDRLRSTIASVAEATGKAVEEVWQARAEANPAGRFGDPRSSARPAPSSAAAGRLHHRPEPAAGRRRFSGHALDLAPLNWHQLSGDNSIYFI